MATLQDEAKRLLDEGKPEGFSTKLLCDRVSGEAGFSSRRGGNNTLYVNVKIHVENGRRVVRDYRGVPLAFET